MLLTSFDGQFNAIRGLIITHFKNFIYKFSCNIYLCSQPSADNSVRLFIVFGENNLKIPKLNFFMTFVVCSFIYFM